MIDEESMMSVLRTPDRMIMMPEADGTCHESGNFRRRIYYAREKEEVP
jgi:hypothetical protein